MYVSIKTVCKSAFNDEAKKAGLAALEKFVYKAVDANSAFDTSKKDKVGIAIMAAGVLVTLAALAVLFLAMQMKGS